MTVLFLVHAKSAEERRKGRRGDLIGNFCGLIDISLVAYYITPCNALIYRDLKCCSFQSFLVESHLKAL
jgi:hypothetical protein